MLLKVFFSLFLLVSNGRQLTVDEELMDYETWRKHGPGKYASDEDASRDVFVANMAAARAHNSRADVSWTQGVNKFSGMSWDSFRSHVLMSPQNCSATHSLPKPEVPRLYTTVAKSMDWRKKMIVSEVKDQGHCGSCWPFSTTGCLEAHHAIKHGTIYELSEQNLVDCAQAYDNHGCEGGLPSHAFEFVKDNGGLNTEFSYPYNGTDRGVCTPNKESWAQGVQVTGVYNMTAGDEDDILDKVGTVGPVSIAFQVMGGFSKYTGGVYSDPNCSKDAMHVNHAVLVVGYGEEDGVPYWLIKNSWGKDWGLGGYFKIERGKNMCGIADCASFPIVA